MRVTSRWLTKYNFYTHLDYILSFQVCDATGRESAYLRDVDCHRGNHVRGRQPVILLSQTFMYLQCQNWSQFVTLY